MKIDILTLFPEMFAPLRSSIIKRAVDKGYLEIKLINIRDFAMDRQKKCDDSPFGGGAGMLMMPDPLYNAVMSVIKKDSKVIYMSPRGKTLNTKIGKAYVKKYEHLIIICGHYEGIDQRILDIFNADELSIGDYVLTGGELAAMVFVDSVSRFVEGVLKGESLEEESFSNNLLEYPQYTRPQIFMGRRVPEVLISGNHAEIEKWRRVESLKATEAMRPDLLSVDDKIELNNHKIKGTTGKK